MKKKIIFFSDGMTCIMERNGMNVKYWYSIHRYKDGEFEFAEIQKDRDGREYFRTQYGVLLIERFVDDL